jgi:hypothetical protein
MWVSSILGCWAYSRERSERASQPETPPDLDLYFAGVVVVVVVVVVVLDGRVVVVEVLVVVVELESAGTTVYSTETVPVWPSLLVAVTE